MYIEKVCQRCADKYSGGPNSKTCSKKCYLEIEYERRKTRPYNSKKNAKKLREDWKKRGLCVSCAGRKAAPNMVRCQVCVDQSKQRRLDLKEETFKKYGGVKCACKGCDISNIMVLELDHINGGGNEDRKTLGSGEKFYLYLKKSGYQDGYRVLCANCNKGRWINGGKCPLHAE